MRGRRPPPGWGGRPGRAGPAFCRSLLVPRGTSRLPAEGLEFGRGACWEAGEDRERRWRGLWGMVGPLRGSGLPAGQLACFLLAGTDAAPGTSRQRRQQQAPEICFSFLATERLTMK